MPKGRYLTIEESADLLSVSTKTIRNWIAAGRVKADRVGPRLVRIDQASLEALVRPITAGTVE